MKFFSKLIIILLIQSNNACALTQRSVIPVTDWIVTPTVTYTLSAFSKGATDMEPSLFLSGANIDLGLDNNLTPNPNTFANAEDDRFKGYALARLVLQDGEKAEILPLAGKDIADQTINQLVLMDDHFPVIATVDASGTNPKIRMLTNLSSAGNFTAGIDLKDASLNPLAVTGPVAGLTTGKFGPYDPMLANPREYIFAAVPANKTVFDDPVGFTRGIAVIEKITDPDNPTKITLKQRDVSQLRKDDATPGSRMIDLGLAEQDFAFGQNKALKTDTRAALLGQDASLWWDEKLERLYIGLKDVRRSANDQGTAMGVLGVGMGYIKRFVGAAKQHSFTIDAIVSPGTKATQVDLFYDKTVPARINTIDRGIGYYFDGATPYKDAQGNITAARNGDADAQISVPFVRTMHTSTGKDYLIVQSQISLGPVVAAGDLLFPERAGGGFLAFPLVPDANDPREIGTIASVNADGVPYYNPAAVSPHYPFKTPQSYEEMPTVDMPSVVIGGNGPNNPGEVKEIFVEGDTVYVACHGTGIEERGIFYSSAIFDGDGFIRAWTPWLRSMGDAINVDGAGLDRKTGNFYMLTTADDTDAAKNSIFNTGSISTWSKGATFPILGDPNTQADNRLSVPLSKVLAEVFPPEEGGVYQIYPFDEFTPGFAEFTLLIAVGRDKVAIIETANKLTGQLTVVYDFAVNKNVFVFSDQALKEISPLIGVEIQADPIVANSNNPGELKIFVHGCGGIAVMTLDTPILPPSIPLPVVSPVLANQFDQLAHISTALNPSPGPKPKFEPFVAALKEPVYAMARSANFAVAALADSGLFEIDFTADKSTTFGSNLVGHFKNFVGSSLVSTANRDYFSADQSQSKAIFIVGTDNGLKATYNDGTPLATPDIPGQIMQLQFLPAALDNTLSHTGMIYALVFGPRVAEEGESEKCLNGEEVLQVYRLAIGSYEADYVTDPNRPIQTDVIEVIDRTKDGKPRPFIQYDDFRTNIAVDGPMLFNVSPRDNDSVDFVRVTEIVGSTQLEKDQKGNPIKPLRVVPKTSAEMLLTQRSLQRDLDLDDSEKHFHVGIIKHDPGSGSVVVPGDWGVRVND